MKWSLSLHWLKFVWHTCVSAPAIVNRNYRLSAENLPPFSVPLWEVICSTGCCWSRKLVNEDSLNFLRKLYHYGMTISVWNVGRIIKISAQDLGLFGAAVSLMKRLNAWNSYLSLGQICSFLFNEDYLRIRMRLRHFDGGVRDQLCRKML